jgi:hypothetical protein
MGKNLDILEINNFMFKKISQKVVLKYNFKKNMSLIKFKL